MKTIDLDDKALEAAMLSLFGVYNPNTNHHCWIDPNRNAAKQKVGAAITAYLQSSGLGSAGGVVRQALIDLCDAWQVEGTSYGGGRFNGNITRAYNAARSALVATPKPEATEGGAHEKEWRSPLGSKRAVVEELKKARSDFMINDLDTSERILDALAALATDEGSQSTEGGEA